MHIIIKEDILLSNSSLLFTRTYWQTANMTICSNLNENSEFGLLSLRIYDFLYIGIFRFLSFIVLFIGYYIYKRYVIKSGSVISSKFFLLLPIYYDYLRFLILFSLIIGILNVIPQLSSTMLSPWGLSLQLGGFHFFYEGLYYFFIQYGAGRNAFMKSFIFAIISFVFTSISFLEAAYYYRNDNEFVYFIVMLQYNVILVALYSVTIAVPMDYIYRRPAMRYYAVIQSVYYLLWILALFLTHYGVDAGYCVAAATYLSLDGVLKPVVIFYSLSIDSQVKIK